MIALLKEAGIKGKYIEIYGGSTPPPFLQDFSFSQANHVIACVPMAKDTLWLECTSQTASPGYMGSFTGNRNALLIDETGGHLVHTPHYNINDNVRVRVIKAIADVQGNLTASISSSYLGLQQDFPHSLMHDASKEEREKYLNKVFNIATYQVLKSNYTEHKGSIPSVDEDLEVLIANYASITGKRLFIAANLFGASANRLQPDTGRRYDYIIKDAYRHIDSAEIKIPAGYTAESIPKDISITTPFGKYTSSVKLIDDKIVYYRLLESYSGRYAAKEYSNLVKFYEQVFKAERSKLVLVKEG